jgi:MOSC domain-containing protein YiiM
MQLISINIGEEQTLQHKDRTEQTGIFKIPTNKPVHITVAGLNEDVIVGTDAHGGPDQAVYVYGMADYDWWKKEIGKKLVPGMFGDNLTISELESAQFNIGDYLHIGAVTLQVTAPRIPCSTFAARMADPQWVKKFRQAERPGLYCRVIKEGILNTETAVAIEKYTGETLSLIRTYRAAYERPRGVEILRQVLRSPISIRIRTASEIELQELLAEKSTKI